MDTYLLDTNLVSALYDPRRTNHQAVRAELASLDPSAVQLISVITIAELRYGLALSQAAGTPLAHIEACIDRAEEHDLVGVGRHTAQAFAHVKSSIALVRLDIRRRVPRWVEGWTDRVTSEMLQIDENDLWIAAQAVERNYVVITGDRDFQVVIGSAVPDLRIKLIS